ncbi:MULTISPECIES: NAD(P)/FAD-dependent oxidoreductase [unclassified Streptomyces]|uniref:FAD-dependent monooxygenase n=2 Tax=Streptomyces TaxID=1883 RepID=A0ABD5DZP4_9ACTN|nr:MULTISPECIES: FAD-dependent monooxygenase [unclassified Streptomyces]ASY34714.1 FAD-binding monooxygenase [Streptomyces sp. CLI2509]EGJ77082.1 putative monooxygenase FAD-binding protein [Streptomyces sp. Tu6071]MDT0414294.1 FAD-dependent monooxygenase [Streptomyces sp. DSM 41982]
MPQETSRPTADGDPTRAVVLGGSIAGLFAARVLAEAYDEVVVVDRDAVTGVDGPRRGRPQGKHINAMHVRGRVVMEELYPGITDQLVADGVPIGDFSGSVRWYFRGRPVKRADIGFIAVPATAPLMERRIRERTAELANVRFAEGCDILGLAASADHARVTGVKIQRRGKTAETIAADLVVDATGRGSRTPLWLEEMGYPRVAEERTDIGLGYVTQNYRMKADPYHGDLAIIAVAHPEVPRGVIFTKTEGDTTLMTVYGILGDHPPTDQQGLYQFVKRLPVPDIHEALQHAEPVDEPVAFRFPTTQRRRYEDMPRFPSGLLVIGDAVSCFNPVYAQGMTVAAMSALTLRRHLHSGATPDGRQYFRDLAHDVIDPPWEMTRTVDLGFDGVEGKRDLKVRVGQRYLAMVQTAATRDPVVTRGYMRAAGMLDRPEQLMRPAMILRVLLNALRGPAGRAAVPPALADPAPSRSGAR